MLQLAGQKVFKSEVACCPECKIDGTALGLSPKIVTSTYSYHSNVHFPDTIFVWKYNGTKHSKTRQEIEC
jgi:hypothetical protein